MKVKQAVMGVMISIVISFVASACGSTPSSHISDTNDKKDGTNGNQQETGVSEQSKKQAGYLFDVNEVSIGVDMDMDELLSDLGEAKSVFESPSCAGEGTAYVYDFGSYEIETYPAEDGKNRIAYITIKDDMVSTAEGIDLSGSKKDILNKYGDEYTENNNCLTYKKGGMTLNFLLDDNENIVSIEYVSLVIG